MARFCRHLPGLSGRRRCRPHTSRNGYQSAARIYPNAISGDGSWCSFSLLDDLTVKLPNEGIFSMDTHRSLWHAVMQAAGSASGAHRAVARGTVRARAARRILVLALVLGGLGAAALTLPGHGSAGQAGASAHQRAARPGLSTAASTITSNAVTRPWMY